jgi:hypothetical protein
MPVELANKLDKPGARTTGGRYTFPMDIDDCGSAAANEDQVLRELQRRVEAAALLLRIFPPLGGRLCDINCKSWNLRFRAPAREITTCHSSLGGEFGERLAPGKDAKHRLRWRERCSRPCQDRSRLADNARHEMKGGLARHEMKGGLTLTDGSNPDFYTSISI